MGNQVSVIVPSYNHADYVIAALESVLNQTYRDFEIVILDDCSSDDSISRIETFIEKHHGIDWQFLRHDENLGGVITINHLIEATHNEYIALINSDDIWLPQKLERQVRILDSNPNLGAVFTQAVFIDSSGQYVNHITDFSPKIFIQENRSRGKWLRKLFFDLNCLCHPSILIRKSVYQDVGLYDPRLRQLPDMLMWIRLLKRYGIHIIEEPLVNMRVHEANTSKVVRETTKRNLNELFFILDEYFNRIPNDTFVDGFGDLFKNPNATTDDELECEKAFMFFQHKSPLESIYTHIGLKKLSHLLENSSTRDILHSKYNFSYSEFHQLSGTTFFNESLLASVYPMGATGDDVEGGLSKRVVMAINKRFLEGWIRSHPIIFKPLQLIWKAVRAFNK